MNSAQLTEALVELSQAKVYIAECTSIDLENNSVVGVSLANGDRIASRNVVVATGPWLSTHLPTRNNVVEGYPLKGEILRMECLDKPLQYTFGWEGNYVCTKPDGLVWAGTTETRSGFELADN